MPLWQTLDPDQRLALLGHELGHQINGDVTRGIWTGTARGTLREWMVLINPRTSRAEDRANRRVARGNSRATGAAGLAAVLAPVFMFIIFLPPYLLVLAANTVLHRLDRSAGWRAEYLADELGARLGSTQAAVGLMDQLALTDSVQVYRLRLHNTADKPADPWDGLRGYLASVPDHEKRRRQRVQELRGVRVDSTHPANALRRRLLLARPAQTGALAVTPDEWAAVEAELAGRTRSLGYVFAGQASAIARQRAVQKLKAQNPTTQNPTTQNSTTQSSTTQNSTTQSSSVPVPSATPGGGVNHYSAVRRPDDADAAPGQPTASA